MLDWSRCCSELSMMRRRDNKIRRDWCSSEALPIESQRIFFSIFENSWEREKKCVTKTCKILAQYAAKCNPIFYFTFVIGRWYGIARENNMLIDCRRSFINCDVFDHQESCATSLWIQRSWSWFQSSAGFLSVPWRLSLTMARMMTRGEVTFLNHLFHVDKIYSVLERSFVPK